MEGDLTPAQAKYKFKQEHEGPGCVFLTVGYDWNYKKSKWVPDPNWPVILFPKRKRKIAFGRFVD